MLRDGTCTAHAEARAALGRDLPPPPLGACMIPIVAGYGARLAPGMQVLEVGCGTWPALRDRCEEAGARWEGIDPEASYFGAPTIATRVENLADLSFEDERFDLVVGSQSMEHWAENGCDTDFGLWQCFRVTRPGGRVCMNVPIHFHGTRDFLLGDTDRIRGRFARFSTHVTLEPWGRPCAPLPEHFAHPGYGPLARRPAWVLDVQAVRDRPLPPRPPNPGLTGRRARLRYWPLRFLVHRWIRARLPGARRQSP